MQGARKVAILIALVGLTGEVIWTLRGEEKKWTRKLANWRISRKMAAEAGRPAPAPPTPPADEA